MTNRFVSLSVGTEGSEDFFQTFQDLSELAANLGQSHKYVSVSAGAIDEDEPEPEQLYFDENTLFKVSKVLMDLGVSSELAADIVNGIQNAGILFRERTPA